MLQLRLHVKKNDLVQVISGEDKGKTGKVMRLLFDKKQIVIEKLHMAKKHVKPSQKNLQGGIIEVETPIAASNVLLVCPKCNKGVRIARKKVKEKKVRVCKKCGEVLDK